MEVDKVLMADGNNGNNDALTAAMMANGGMNNWMNNPFAYMMFMSLFNNMGWGGNNRGGNPGNVSQGFADAGLSAQIQNLSNQMTDNQNSNITNGNINNVNGSVKDNGVAFNAAMDLLNSTLCNIKTSILEQGYQNQLANCGQTNTILMQAQNLQNAVQNGITGIGFQIERNACDIKETSTANTQKIVDTLTSKWSTDAAAKITQLEDKIATIEQTNALISALKTTTTTTA